MDSVRRKNKYPRQSSRIDSPTPKGGASARRMVIQSAFALRDTASRGFLVLFEECPETVVIGDTFVKPQ